jgi:DMSO/TMAO reductase YedYZ molybdopterin-dependent catalytic subunit
LSRFASILAELQATREKPRRFTGSRGFGLFSGNDFPVTGESTIVLDARKWQLVVDGAVQTPQSFSYDDLFSFPQQILTEAIDCHNGWYSVQDWQGIPLVSLLDRTKVKENSTGVRLVSATGLSNTYPMVEVGKILLATHSTGQVLASSHGFPLRAVVTGRRGWFWMKWLTRIEVLEDPLEVAGGILCAPLQVFREIDDPRVSTDIR